MANDRTVLSDYTQYNANELYPNNISTFIDARTKTAIGNIPNRLPAIVQEYDAKTNTVVVKVAIKLLTPKRQEDGSYVSVERALVTTTVQQPFANLSNGGIGIVYGLKKGDRGWIEAADRDTTLFKDGEMGEPTDPASFAGAQYRFGSFSPDIISGFTLQSADEGCLSIQTLKGDMRFVLDPATKQIRVFCPNVIFTGNVAVNGNITSTGTITGDGDVVFSGISAKTHVHGGVQRGGGNTNAPVK